MKKLFISLLLLFLTIGLPSIEASYTLNTEEHIEGGFESDRRSVI